MLTGDVEGCRHADCIVKIRLGLEAIPLAFLSCCVCDVVLMLYCLLLLLLFPHTHRSKMSRRFLRSSIVARQSLPRSTSLPKTATTVAP